MAEKHSLISMWQRFRSNVLLRRLLTVLSLDVLVKASAFVLMPLYLRLMTQAEYGIFNYILSIVYAYAVILNLGLYVPQSKLYHDFTDKKEKGKLIYNINLLMLAGLLVLVLPVYCFGVDYYAVKLLFTNAVNYQRYRWLVLLMTLTSLLAYMLTNFFYTAERIDLIKRFNLIRVIGINVISLGALYFLKNRDSVQVRFIGIGFVEGGLILTFYIYYIRIMQPRIDRQLIIRCLKLGLPILFSTLFSIIINYGDTFFLEKYSGYKELSIYYLAFSFSSIISLISMSLQNVWLPLFFKEKDLEKNMAKTRRMIVRLTLGLVALSVIIVIAVVVLLYLQIIPPNYHAILYVLPIMLISQILVCLAILYSNYLFYFEKTAFVLLSGVIISVISILMNMYMVARFNIYGAALTLLVANGLYLTIYYSFFLYYRKKQLQQPIYGHL
jgi:O-antigen/teichoic acid export membrane protein